MNTPPHAEFQEFQNGIRAGRLYDRAYGYYGSYLLAVLLGIALSGWILVVTDNVFIQILNAAFLGFVLVQGGMLAHDLTHGQVFRSKEVGRWSAVFAWGLFGGLSADKWFEKHNTHHKYVNQVDSDPDLDIPFIFSEKQRKTHTSWLHKLLLPKQHILFFLLLPLVYVNMVGQAYVHIFQRFTWRSFLELALITIHFVVLLGATFLLLPWYVACAFLLVHLMVSGVYMSLVFAPNHKGLEVLGPEVQVSWLHQILCTRNVYPSHLVFHVLGGLNFQIEHHLFSDMARPNYWRVQKYVKEFCKNHRIPYYETTWTTSMKEIYESLRAQARSV